MFNEILTPCDYENSYNEFDIESIPFFKDSSFDFDKNDLFLPFNHCHYQIFNQEIDFEGIKSIKEYDSEQSMKIEKNKNQIDIQSIGLINIFYSMEDILEKKYRTI